MRRAGRLAAETLDMVAPHVRPGVTTGELDRLCHDFMVSRGAVPATLGYRGYTKSCCTSVNHVVCHGIPGDKALKKVCSAAGVKSIYDYVSMDPDELGDFLEDEEVEAPDSLPPEQWFPPEEGLNWASKLAQYLKANPTVIKGSSGVLEDLAEYEVVFKGLHARGVRWHFQVDF